MKSGIYKITCLVNNRFYIGSAYDVKGRIWRHQDDCSKKKYKNKHMQRAWNKYGSKNFKFEILEYCAKNRLLKIEQHYLDTLLFAQEYIKTKGKDKRFLNLGFNVSPTAKSTRGVKVTLGQIAKTTAKTRGQKRTIDQVNNLKNSWTPDRRKRHSKKMKKIFKDPIKREKRRKIAKNLWKNPEYRSKVIVNATKGLQTEEYRNKIKNRPRTLKQCRKASSALRKFYKKKKKFIYKRCDYHVKKIYAFKDGKLIKDYCTLELMSVLRISHKTLIKKITLGIPIRKIVYKYEVNN